MFFVIDQNLELQYHTWMIQKKSHAACLNVLNTQHTKLMLNAEVVTIRLPLRMLRL